MLPIKIYYLPHRALIASREALQFVKLVRELSLAGLDCKSIFEKITFDGNSPDPDWIYEVDRFVVHCLECMHDAALYLSGMMEVFFVVNRANRTK